MATGGVATLAMPREAMSDPSHTTFLSVPSTSQTSRQPELVEEPETINTFAVLAVILIYRRAREDWERDRRNLAKHEALKEATDLVLDLVQNCAQMSIEALRLLSASLEPFL